MVRKVLLEVEGTHIKKVEDGSEKTPFFLKRCSSCKYVIVLKEKCGFFQVFFLHSHQNDPYLFPVR